ncbi:MAG: heavy metal translocating P-type ATPase [Litorilinea sp.]
MPTQDQPENHPHAHDSHTHHAADATDAREADAQKSHSEHSEHAATGQPALAAAHGKHGGHGAGHDAGHIDHSGHELTFRNRFWVCLVLTVPVLLYSHMLQMWFGFTAPAFPGSDWIGPLFATVIFIYGGIPFLQMAAPEVRNRRPGMMVLISLAITVAYIYSLATIWLDPAAGFFWEMALLIDVMLLGHWLEMRSVRQASGALDELAKLMPDAAERITAAGETETVPVDRLQIDDKLLVRPGATIPADGEVVEGSSSVDESMLTGESRPIKKAAAGRVIAGSINGDGSLRVRVTAIGQETALAGIMRLVDDAQQSKSPTQMLADRAAGWLFYIALAVALATAIGWTIAIGFDLEIVKRVATVLVIACPHALGLAIPLVVAISTSLSARNGILIRNRLALEDARTIDTVIFDKTGTLTRGEQGVVSLATVDAPGDKSVDGTEADTRAGMDDDTALALAAAVEGDSEHMIGRALRESAAAQKLELPAVANFAAIQGRGVSAEVAGKTVYVGGPRLLEMLELTPPSTLDSFIQSSESKGQAIIYLIADARVVAAFALADVIRPESHGAVQKLQKMGIHVVMLTGDSRAVAEAVAQELGIDQFFAEVLPNHKDDKIKELQRQGAKVAMVGDGVNDAPALTRADIGIAIGSGTDVAVESADIILVQSNPQDVVRIFTISRATHRKMIQNLWWATGYNIVALPLAAGILAGWGINLSPAVGALLMSISTIVVAINAQLLRRLSLSDQP